MKRTVKNFAAMLLCCSFALPSCNKNLLPSSLFHPGANAGERGPGSRGPSGEDESRPENKPDVIFSAVVFEDGYNWVQDSLFGNGTACVELWKNYRRTLSFNAGKKYRISTDADFHCLHNGNIYCGFAGDDGRTTVSVNGRILYEYQGRERLSSVYERNGKLHVLSTSLSGKGFSYRVNGEKMLENTNGIPSGLYCDSGLVYFWYILTLDGYSEFHLVRNGSDKIIESPLPDFNVLCARLIDGEEWLGLAQETEYACIWRNGVLFEAYVPGESVTDMDMLVSPMGYALLLGTGFPGNAEYNHTVSGCGYSNEPFCDSDLFWAYDDGCLALLNYNSSYRSLGLWISGMLLQYISGPCYFSGPDCLKVYDGRSYFAATPCGTGTGPFVAEGDKVHECGFNGYFTGLEISPPTQ